MAEEAQRAAGAARQLHARLRPRLEAWILAALPAEPPGEEAAGAVAALEGYAAALSAQAGSACRALVAAAVESEGAALHVDALAERCAVGAQVAAPAGCR